MKIVLISPPFVQLNTPYPAVPVLARFLRKYPFEVVQRDFSLDATLQIFTPDMIRKAAAVAKVVSVKEPENEKLAFYLYAADDYARAITGAVLFLQGKAPELAWRIANRNYLPEGPYFQQTYADSGEDAEELLLNEFGRLGMMDKAKKLCSLFLDDVVSFIAMTLDPGFGFGKYEEHLAVSLPALDPMLKRLEAAHTEIDRIIDRLTEQMLEQEHPDFVGLSVPFPGTLYGALRIARTIRAKAPQVKIILGGGYVNSELRSMSDARVFDFVDFVSFDEGFVPVLSILTGQLMSEERHAEEKTCQCTAPFVLTSQGRMICQATCEVPEILVPDYCGVNMGDYLNVVESQNPLERIWSDGLWMKMQLTKGCYWHKCTFCDLALDYIGRYQPGKPAEIVDAMEMLVAETGHCGFHFVDEALAPSLLADVSREILRRKLCVSWWGNVRFDTSFTEELAELMASAGCIAVTGGLECANDRLLKLMNKGITLKSARKAMAAFSNAGILVHAYLMYGFPTETKEEVAAALNFVRQCFDDGILQSAFWHRFALTVHSEIARNPEKYHIRIEAKKSVRTVFAMNEISYSEPGAPDWGRIGRRLAAAVYNYMMDRGLDIPPKQWLK